MIVWSGRGILSVLILLVSFGIFVSVLPTEAGDYSFVLAFFIAAAFSWFLGRKWNEGEGKSFIDKETGQEIVIRPNHSLFWIKMQYWGVIFGIIGVVILVQNFI